MISRDFYILSISYPWYQNMNILCRSYLSSCSTAAQIRLLLLLLAFFVKFQTVFCQYYQKTKKCHIVTVMDVLEVMITEVMITEPLASKVKSLASNILCTKKSTSKMSVVSTKKLMAQEKQCLNHGKTEKTEIK